MSSGMILRAKMIKSQQFVEKRVEQTADPGQSRAQAVPGSGESPGLEASPSAAAALADKAEARASLQPGHSGAESEPGRQGKEQGARKSAEARVLSAAGGVESVAKGGGSLAAGSRTSLLPAYVVRQVALGMERMTAQNLDHLSLSLKPPSLGEISMDLAVKDGAVKASLVAETVAAKKALEAGLDSLKQHLAGQGIKVQQIEISVQPDAQRRQERAQDGEKQNRRPRREQTEASAETEAANSAFLNGRLSVHA
jgi:flagellar hook-length control protein FliK